MLILNVLLCEAGKTSIKPEPEPEPEEADLLVQYGVSGVIPEPESEPGYQGYYSSPNYNWHNYNNNNGVNYNNNYYQPGNLKF